MKKTLILLSLTIGVAQAAPIQSQDCQDAILNVAVLSAVTKGRFDNPDVSPTDTTYKLSPLTNTLMQETLKQLSPTSQAGVIQLAGLASAMQTKLFNTLPDMQKVAIDKCAISGQEVLNLATDRINKDDAKIRKAGYKFLQIFVPNWLKAYGYIQ